MHRRQRVVILRCRSSPVIRRLCRRGGLVVGRATGTPAFGTSALDRSRNDPTASCLFPQVAAPCSRRASSSNAPGNNPPRPRRSSSTGIDNCSRFRGGVGSGRGVIGGAGGTGSVQARRDPGGTGYQGGRRARPLAACDKTPLRPGGKPLAPNGVGELGAIVLNAWAQGLDAAQPPEGARFLSSS